MSAQDELHLTCGATPENVQASINLMFGLAVIFFSWMVMYYLFKQLLRSSHRKNVALTATLLFHASVPTILCRYLSNYRWSVVAALCILGTAVYLNWQRIKKVVPPADHRPTIDRTALLVGTVTTGFVAWGLISGHFWDENAAHFGVSSALARGVSPPEHPLFPGQIFRYHYGFNSLVAAVIAFSSIDAATAIDIVSILCFAALLIGAYSCAEDLGGKSAGRLAIVLVPLGSGLLQHLLFSDFGILESPVKPFPAEWQNDIPPPVISNFFQHPQGLAMATVFGVIQHFNRDESRHFSFWNCALLVAAFSVSHIVFFGLLGLGLGVSSLFNFLRTKSFLILTKETVCLSLGLILAFLAGGFLGTDGVQDNHITFQKDFFEEAFPARLGHHLVLFGLPFLFLPVAFLKILKTPHRILLTMMTMVLIGFAVPNMISYERSWDIVKFLGVAMFFTNFLLASFLPSLNINKFAVALILLLSCATGSTWLLRVSIFDGKLGIPKMHFPAPQPIAQKTAEVLSPMLSASDRVFSTNVDMSKVGLLTPGFNWRQFGRGYIMDRGQVDLQLRAAQRIRRNLSYKDIKSLGIRYLILSPADVKGLSKEAKRRLQDPDHYQFTREVRSHTQKRFIYKVLNQE